MCKTVVITIIVLSIKKPAKLAESIHAIFFKKTFTQKMETEEEIAKPFPSGKDSSLFSMVSRTQHSLRGRRVLA